MFPLFLETISNLSLSMSTWYLNCSSDTGRYLFLWWGVENSIMVVSLSASHFNIGFSVVSFLLVDTHILLSFNVVIEVTIWKFLFLESNTWTKKAVINIGALNWLLRIAFRTSIGDISGFCSVALLPVWNPSSSTNRSQCCYLLSQILTSSTLQLQHVSVNLQQSWSKHSLCYSKFWQFVITCDNIWHCCFA